jgi:hypothetical protein
VAVGFSSAAANAILDTFVGTYDYIQLHTGDPGAAGTANVAGNATRKQITWGSAASGVVANSAAVSWSSGEVDTSEDYTHYSLWDASTVGNFGKSGTVTANAVTSGDTFTIPIGDHTETVTTLAS